MVNYVQEIMSKPIQSRKKYLAIKIIWYYNHTLYTLYNQYSIKAIREKGTGSIAKLLTNTFFF